jgi:5,10-methylenetetrahydromethanopterin reductase
MRVAVRLVQFLGSPREIVDLAVLAEQAGVDEVWIPHDPFMTNAWTVATAIAEATDRVVVGTIGTNPYTTDPSEIATHLATLDLLSGGRAALGLGLHTGTMVRWLGYDPHDTGVRIARSVELIRTLLRGETAVAADWPYAWSEECSLRFTPLRPDPPILVAGHGKELLRLAGAVGDGAMPMATPPESVALLAADVAAGAAAAGRDPEALEISACAWLSLSADAETATATLRRMIATFGPHLEPRALATIGLAPGDFRELGALATSGALDDAAALVTAPMLRLALAGTPADVVARIAALSDLGVTTINLGGPLGPDPAEAIRLVGERIVPALRVH